MSEPFILAQLSDTHVRTDDGGAAVRNLRRALAQANEYKPDVVLLTGDLVNDERAEEYTALAEALTDAPEPLYLLTRNHDDRALLRKSHTQNA